MKSLLSTATIICYSLFSFLFSALCPAICLGSEVVGICPAVCESIDNETTACCSAPCSIKCEDAEPLVICAGAYGTLNSWRCAVDCPTPVKTPVTLESYRLIKDVIPFSSMVPSCDRNVTVALRHRELDSPMSSMSADMIATTVLRI